MNIRNLIVAGIIMTVSSATLSEDEYVGHTIQCNGFRQKRI